MAKQYDAAIKQLVERHPADWLAFAGLPPAANIEVVDADLSAISPAADTVIRVSAAEPYVAHLEFQSGADAEFDRRMLLYNVLLRWRHRLPVRTVAMLLRPQAQGRGTTGAVIEINEPDQRLEFRYRMIRLWEQPVESLLTGGLGILPLAPIGKVAEHAVERVIESMKQRLAKEAAPGEEAEAWAATLVLLGLRYSSQVGRNLLRGVGRMKESTTYQAIIEEGKAEGQISEARSLLLRLGRKKLGAPSPTIQARLEAIADLARLESLAERLYDVSGWDELLAASE